LPIPDSLEPASLDAFISSLLAAGFDPVGDQRSWVGPLHPALEHLTDERTMRVEVRDGWPYLHPKVYVQGLAPGLHRNYHGDICLWDDGDPSLDWLTWDGIARRIEEWAAEAPATATADDPALDAHLYFEGGSKGLATIDLSGVKVRDWEARGVRGTQKDGLLEIGNGPLHGRLYTRSAIKTPPRDLAAVRHLLRRRQQRDFDEAISSVGSPDGVSFLILAWNTEIGPNLLVLWLERANGALKATSFEAARTDCEVLLLRAGPDRSQLAQRTVAILGLGAVGSQLALLLARSGVGTLAVFDPQRLRPADVVRHAASSLFVGRSKVAAMKSAVLLQAPWTKVLAADRSHWEPSQLAEIARNVDLVVDAVGSASFTVQLARVCEAEARRLLSVSLYRYGDVARVRHQAAAPIANLADRAADTGFPTIPPDVGEAEVAWEAGCGAPITQAPPTSVASAAAAAARLAIEVLCGRETRDLDLVEVYRPLAESPFDVVGSRIFRPG
jgi:molybdopterin/thiamine biosynthesis adenylyltransferase